MRIKWRQSIDHLRSPLRVILKLLIKIDFSAVELRPQVRQHSLDSELLLPLHVIIEAAQVRDGLLQVNFWRRLQVALPELDLLLFPVVH